MVSSLVEQLSNLVVAGGSFVMRRAECSTMEFGLLVCKTNASSRLSRCIPTFSLDHKAQAILVNLSELYLVSLKQFGNVPTKHISD